MLSKLAALTGALTLGLAGTASAAVSGDLSAQANPTKTCAPLTCLMSFGGFPGGTLAVDVDADGQGWGTWMIRDTSDRQICRTEFQLEAPAQSWNCGPLAAGNYKQYVVINSFTNVNWISMGVRW